METGTFVQSIHKPFIKHAYNCYALAARTSPIYPIYAPGPVLPPQAFKTVEPISIGIILKIWADDDGHFFFIICFRLYNGSFRIFPCNCRYNEISKPEDDIYPRF